MALLVFCHFTAYALFTSLCLSHSVSQSVTHTLTHSYTRSFIHSLTHSLTHLLTQSLTHSLAHSLIHSLTQFVSLTHTYTHPLLTLPIHTFPEKQVFLSSFLVAPASLRPPSSSSRPSLRRALQCHIVRHTQRVVRRLELTAALHDQWRQFVTYVCMYMPTLP